MRIGIITDSIEKGPTSISIYTRSLIQNLLKVKPPSIELVLIHSEKSSDPIYEEVEEIILPPSAKKTSHSSFPLRILSFTGNLIYGLLRDTKVQSKILDTGIDILHIPHLVSAKVPPLGFIGLVKRLKLVVTLHGVAPLVVPPRLYYEGRALISRTLTYIQVLKWKYLFRNRFDLMIAVSESEKRNISRKLSIPEEKIKVIYHGVSDKFRPLSEKDDIRRKLKKKYRIEYPFIFHVSAYQQKKNVEGIIKAYYLCKRYKIREKLVIGGRQPEHLRRLSLALGLGRDVIFTGFIQEDDLPSFYNVTEVFIFPSFHESFGMPILEAMACGTPVITSNVFSMPEIAGDAAVLVNPYSVREIAKAIYRVLTNEDLREELRRKGLKRAEQFSWRKSAEEHLKAYRMVVEE